MENILDQKVHIGISACQFGCKVRYNGKGWDMTESIGRERNDFIWHPVCPEVMSGLGIPRTPISLKHGSGDQFWEGTADIKSRSGQILNHELAEGAGFCMNCLKKAGVSVFIFMEGSPSCGVYRTTLKDERLGNPPGIFGSLLLKENFFLIPAKDLQSPLKWWDWRRRMLAFLWFGRQNFLKPAEVVESWHILKFLCQELSRKDADIIGKKLADLKKISAAELAEIKQQILNLLRKPSDLKNIKQWLWKNYIFMKKKFGVEIDEVKTPTDLRNLTHIAKELLQVEITSKNQELLFGSSPIRLKK